MEYYVKLNILYTYFVIKSETERLSSYFGIALKLINTYFEKSSLLFSGTTVHDGKLLLIFLNSA